MKTYKRRISILVTLCICLTMLFSFSITSFAAGGAIEFGKEFNKVL